MASQLLFAFHPLVFILSALVIIYNYIYFWIALVLELLIRYGLSTARLIMYCHISIARWTDSLLIANDKHILVPNYVAVGQTNGYCHHSSSKQINVSKQFVLIDLNIMTIYGSCGAAVFFYTSTGNTALKSLLVFNACIIKTPITIEMVKVGRKTFMTISAI